MGPIETDIPQVIRRGRLPGPVRERMEVLRPGDSFLLETHDEWRYARGTVHKLKPKRFSIHKIAHEGWRIWRIE